MDGKKPEMELPEGQEDYTPAPTQIADDPHHDIHQLQQQALQGQLKNFWDAQREETENTLDFNHALPLARIKKIMKADDSVKMVAAETLVLFSKACEIFIKELTMRAWVNAEENRTTALKKSDIASAILRTDMYGFLNVVPRNETAEHEVYVGIPPTRDNAAKVVQNVPPHPFNYVPSPPQHFAPRGPSHGVIPPGMVMASPPFDHPVHAQPPPYPYGLQVAYPAPEHSMMENFLNSDDQNKK